MLLALAFFMTIAQEHPADRPVAQCAGTTISYGDIGVYRGQQLPPRPPSSPPQTDDENFHQMEQQRLNFRIAALLIDSAGQRPEFHASQSEIDAATPALVRDESAYRKSFEPDIAVARAAKRVLHGEDEHKVFDEAVARYAGMTFSLFQNRVKIFRNEKTIDEFLSKDHAGIARTRALDDARHGVIIRKIREALEKQSEATRTSLDVVKAAFWNELVREAGVTILDPTFALPDWKGIL